VGETGPTVSFEAIPPDQARQLTSPKQLPDNAVLKRSHELIYVRGCMNQDPTDENFIPSGEPNRSAAAINPELLNSTDGPLLFFGRCADLNTMDFRHIVDFILVMHDQGTRVAEAEAAFNDATQGVRINSVGDVLLLGTPPYEPHGIADEYFEIGECHLIPVAEKLGLSLVTYPVPQSLSWKGRPAGARGDYATNVGFANLNSRKWNVPIGSVLVARKNKKPLHVAHVEALIEYLGLIGGAEIAALAMERRESADTDMEPMLKRKSELMIERASKKQFEKYWVEWMEKIGRARHGNVVSPYKV
jgi:hypothetical protein